MLQGSSTNMIGEPLIIGITGLKYSGKDSCGIIFNTLGFETVKYAGGLKAMISALLVYNERPIHEIERIIEGDLKQTDIIEFEGRSCRHAMQTLGTEWGRDLIGTDLWVNTFYRKASKFSRVVCTDVRFENEVKFIQDKGGFVFRVEREGQELGTDPHPSETSIMNLPVDGIIPNVAASNWRQKLEMEVMQKYEMISQ